MNKKNGNLGNVALVDAIEERQDQESGKFYNPNDPVLKAPKPINTEKKRSWKRKLVTWGLILLLIGGGVLALYLLLKVKRVDIRVQADSRRNTQNAKAKTDSGNSESGLTADAINIARAATGADIVAGDKTNPSALPSALPLASPQFDNVERNLSYQGNLSPVNDSLNDTGTKDDVSPQQDQLQQQGKGDGFAATLIARSHSNPTQSIFVGETTPKPATATQEIAPETIRSRPEKNASLPSPKTPAAVLPPFGTMLSVRTQGVIFSLRDDSYARLELTRDHDGQGWSLPKGTVLVGRTTGNEYDRAFVTMIGYIDPRDNKLVKITGEVLGSDGATGIPGKRIGVDRNRFKQTLRKVASSGMQVAGIMAGALAGRGTVVIDGAGSRVLNPITNEARGVLLSDDKKTFVKVEAGQPAYVMVSDLPKGISAVDAPGDDALTDATRSLTDREVMELILFGTREEIRAAIPLMTEEQKRLTLSSLAQENDGK